MTHGLLLEAQKISLSWGNRQILKDISFGIKKGEIVTIIGPNGSGKTSLARILLGLLKPTSGKIVKQQPLTIGYMPQKLTLDPALPITVRRFLRLQLGKNRATEADFIRVVEEVGVTSLLETQLHDLSGGEMQRVMLARALLPIPGLLVMDEPVQGVDIQGQSAFYQLIEKIRSLHNTGILMISHDLHMVMKTTDHVICINHHICCQGSPENVSNHPAYRELFGAEAIQSIAIYSHHHDHEHDIHGEVVK